MRLSLPELNRVWDRRKESSYTQKKAGSPEQIAVSRRHNTSIKTVAQWRGHHRVAITVASPLHHRTVGGRADEKSYVLALRGATWHLNVGRMTALVASRNGGFPRLMKVWRTITVGAD
jgi:hypothetical protein